MIFNATQPKQFLMLPPGPDVSSERRTLTPYRHGYSRNHVAVLFSLQFLPWMAEKFRESLLSDFSYRINRSLQINRGSGLTRHHRAHGRETITITVLEEYDEENETEEEKDQQDPENWPDYEWEAFLGMGFDPESAEDRETWNEYKREKWRNGYREREVTVTNLVRYWFVPDMVLTHKTPQTHRKAEKLFADLERHVPQAAENFQPVNMLWRRLRHHYRKKEAMAKRRSQLRRQ